MVIEKDLTFQILWPKEKQIEENRINNNSIVAKLSYGNFSCIFTGDIEKIAERQMLEEYKKDLSILKSTVLKVPHHGSKTSSTEEFLNAVKPKIALIGVGEKNTFGHPNSDVLKRLEQSGGRVFRTDEHGEVTIRINRKEKIWINKMINQENKEKNKYNGKY